MDCDRGMSSLPIRDVQGRQDVRYRQDVWPGQDVCLDKNVVAVFALHISGV